MAIIELCDRVVNFSNYYLPLSSAVQDGAAYADAKKSDNAPVSTSSALSVSR